MCSSALHLEEEEFCANAYLRILVVSTQLYLLQIFKMHIQNDIKYVVGIIRKDMHALGNRSNYF